MQSQGRLYLSVWGVTAVFALLLTPASLDAAEPVADQKQPDTSSKTTKSKATKDRPVRTVGYRSTRPARYSPRTASHKNQRRIRTVFDRLRGNLVAGDEEIEGQLTVEELVADDGFLPVEEEGYPCWGCGAWLENLSFFGGTHSFKGPIDMGNNGNFGYHTGLNLGIPVSYDAGIGFQVGASFSQSDYSGSSITTDERDQTFFTAGIFRRNDFGLQGGVALDVLNDDFFDDVDLQQLRGELSWNNGCGTEFGATVMLGTRDARTSRLVGSTPISEDWDVNNQYRIFIRRQFDNGGEGRIFGGFTDRKDGIVGGDILIPINDTWALQAVSSYLIPEQSTGTGNNAGHASESWGMMINMVWTPRCFNQCGDDGLFRPLFDVVNNTTMFYRRQ